MSAPSRGRKRQRLSRSGDFDRVYKRGRSQSDRFCVLYSFPREGEEADGEARLGVSVSRRVGDAVRRNAVKRALREGFWADESIVPQGCDFVVVARPDIAGLIEREGGAGVEHSLRELLGKMSR